MRLFIGLFITLFFVNVGLVEANTKLLKKILKIVEKLDIKVQELDAKISTVIEDNVPDFAEKIDKIEKQTEEIHTKTESIEKKVDRIDLLLKEQKIEIEAINSTTKKIEVKVESVENLSFIILEKVSKIDETTQTIEDKIFELESNTVANVVSELKDLFGCHICIEQMGILIVGGVSDAGFSSVEALTEDGKPLCILDNLPDDRRCCSADSNLVCGGLYSPTCVKFIEGNWQFEPYTLDPKRSKHVSWQQPGDELEVRLYGGQYSNYTTTIVTNSDQNLGYNMSQPSSYSCSIKLENYAVIAGGYVGNVILATVTKYDTTGPIENLPDLNFKRKSAGCGYYHNEKAQLVYLVTGGANIMGVVSTMTSTEILIEGQSQWKVPVNGDLPSRRSSMAGISINNKIFMTGGYTPSMDDVLLWDNIAEKWMYHSHLQVARRVHAASVIPMKDIKPFCKSIKSKKQKKQAKGFQPDDSSADGTGKI